MFSSLKLTHSPRRSLRGAGAVLGRAISRRPELLLFAVLLAIFNLPLLFGSCWRSMILVPAAVGAGEWWRVLTYPFVHATWYHLALDGVAFLTLYHGLAERSVYRRLSYVAAAGAGSLVVPCLTASGISTHGLCGLSGVAHGLMAVSALEMIGNHGPRSPEGRAGLVCFLIVVGKAAVEALSGRMFLGFLHFGLMGEPIAVSHAGGIIGGILAAGFLITRGADLAQTIPAPVRWWACSDSNREPKHYECSALTVELQAHPTTLPKRRTTFNHLGRPGI
jgi:rhomboid family GlyGly-CTERM serine protease